MLPIRTVKDGLCYKLEVSNGTIPVESELYFPFRMTLANFTKEADKLTKFHLLVAAENTWQGIIFENWPYSEYPPMTTNDVTSGIYAVRTLDLKEKFWINLDGEDDLDSCLSNKEENGCLSIFDHRTFKTEIRYILYVLHTSILMSGSCHLERASEIRSESSTNH